MAYSLPAHSLARPTRTTPRQRVLIGCLLLSLLIGFAPRLAAQELVPGTYDLAMENLYPRPRTEEYRRQRVRAVLVVQQAASRHEAGRPLVITPVSYQEFDAQGRLTRQYWPQEGRLARRLDVAYGPTGDELVSATSYHRFNDPTDTTRLGQLWLPDSHTNYPPPTSGTGTVATWNERTGDWQLTERYRRWQHHDTTYLATTKAPSGKLAALDRTYYVGPGQRLWRQDKLLYTENGLYKVDYTYARFHKKQILELGQLDFQQEFIDYVTSHPEAAALTSHYPPTQQRDELARHAADHQQPLVTQTVDKQGLVLSRTAAGIRTTYERDAHGQLRQCQHYRADELWQLAHFTYLPSGLLARATAFDQQGEQTGALLYSYRYY